MAKKSFVAAVLTCGTYAYAPAVSADLAQPRAGTIGRKIGFTAMNLPALVWMRRYYRSYQIV
jgi:hypothetical protein